MILLMFSSFLAHADDTSAAWERAQEFIDNGEYAALMERVKEDMKELGLGWFVEPETEKN